MSKNPEEFMYECPKCAECFVLEHTEVSDNYTYTCKNCGEEIRFAVSGGGEITGTDLSQITMDCPQCGGGFTLHLGRDANGSISTCEHCGAEIEFTKEILQQLRDDIHGIEKRNVIDGVK